MPAHWRLILAGSAGYGARETLDRIEQSPAQSRILITGYIPNAELGAWYQRAKIFAFPSLDEGFGMPVLEAMAAGVAVVSSSQQALAEVCGQAAILVDPVNTDALGDALVRMACDVELRENYIRLGRQHAAKFTWSDSVAKTWRVYESLL
jgi:glycosyltransferase involved in cell wall biosynthesis